MSQQLTISSLSSALALVLLALFVRAGDMHGQVTIGDPAALVAARAAVCEMAAANDIHVVLTMDWDSPEGILNAAFVISSNGEIAGVQHKNLLAPSEDATFVPGKERELFDVDGVPFGVAICIEGWRYPETVRWAATRGARLVFHPTLSGCDAPDALERDLRALFGGGRESSEERSE